MARRASERGDATFGGTARPGRELPPAWARGLTPDEARAEGEARRLDLSTDPSTIDDDDVRARFERRLNHIQEHNEDPADDDAGGPSRRPRKSAAGPRIGRPSLSPSDGSGFALGLILYALGINFLRYGWPGVTGWISAKFVNKPMIGAASVPALNVPDKLAKSPADLTSQGLIPAGAQGVTNPLLLKHGAIQGADGLWYPVTKKAGQQKVIGSVSRVAG